MGEPRVSMVQLGDRGGSGCECQSIIHSWMALMES